MKHKKQAEGKKQHDTYYKTCSFFLCCTHYKTPPFAPILYGNSKRLYRSWLILSNNFVRYKIKHSSGYFSENATGQSYSTQLRIQCQCLFPVSSRAGRISTSRFQLIFFSFFHCCRQSLYQKPDLLRSA